MIFRNKTKYLMYKTLIKFKKFKDLHITQDYIIKKYKLRENEFGFIINECVNYQFIDGVVQSKSINNHFSHIYKDYIYITSKGYEFLKDYYSSIFKLLRDFLLIGVTAIVTVLINNELSNSNQTVNICNDVVPQDISFIRVTNNCDN